MPERAIDTPADALNSRERLIHAVLDAWDRQGHAAISTRSLAQAAGLPVSSIYHHFGSLEHLFQSAQQHGRAAAEQWCAERLDEIGDAPLPADAFPALLAGLIDEWSCGERHHALVWRECHMLAVRDDRYWPELAAWAALWSRFIQTICERCGYGAHGELTALIFDSESLLHLMRWLRVVDRACLDEMCRAWACWLTGSLAPEGPLRRFARDEAMRSMPQLSPLGPVGQRIASAAADVLERRGMAGLTHRAVAAEAGLTLGVVSHNARTIADLVRVAFEAIYLRVISGAGNVRLPEIQDPDDEAITGFRTAPIQMLAMDELLLAVTRNADLRPFIPQLRYLRGRSAVRLLQSLLGPETTVSPVDAALLSGLIAGLKRACVGKTDAEIRDYGRRIQHHLLRMLGRI